MLAIYTVGKQNMMAKKMEAFKLISLTQLQIIK